MGKSVTGRELQVGDVINTWAGKKRFVAFRPYAGPLAHLWPHGARLADFDIGVGMTVPNDELFELVSFSAKAA